MLGKISFNEQVIRYAVGTLLIVLSVLTLQIPIWFACVANYPIFTAMVQWDPFYALFDAARRRFAHATAPVLETCVSS
jgi:hypothetical protein